MNPNPIPDPDPNPSIISQLSSPWKRAVHWLVQVIGVTAALVFGAFSVTSWQNSETAKAQADVANAVALLAHCSAVLIQNDNNNVCTIQHPLPSLPGPHPPSAATDRK